MDQAQFRELASFAQFGTADLDRATRAQLERGQRSTEILKQPQNKPMSMARQVAVFYVITNGYMDDVPIPQCREFEDGFQAYMEASQSALESKISDAKDLTSDLEDELKKAIEDFKSTFMLSVQ